MSSCLGFRVRQTVIYLISVVCVPTLGKQTKVILFLKCWLSWLGLASTKLSLSTFRWHLFLQLSSMGTSSIRDMSDKTLRGSFVGCIKEQANQRFCAQALHLISRIFWNFNTYQSDLATGFWGVEIVIWLTTPHFMTHNVTSFWHF